LLTILKRRLYFICNFAFSLNAFQAKRKKINVFFVFLTCKEGSHPQQHPNKTIPIIIPTGRSHLNHLNPKPAQMIGLNFQIPIAILLLPN